MEMFGKTLCVSYRELVEGGILSKSSYKKYVYEGKLVVAQRGGRNREALIYYETMYEPIRKNYDAKNPKAKEKSVPFLGASKQGC